MKHEAFVRLSSSVFINNSAIIEYVELDEIVIQDRIFPGRGGGAYMIVNALNALNVIIEQCYFKDSIAKVYGGKDDI